MVMIQRERRGLFLFFGVVVALASSLMGPAPASRVSPLRRLVSPLREKKEVDIEAARSSLERMVEYTPEVAKGIRDLTREESLRRETDLVKSLGAAESQEDVKKALESLWHFWFAEYGQTNFEKLQQIDALIGGGKDNWDAAERLTTALVEDFPEWIEPKNRLATIYFLRGRVDDSVALCEEVIRAKPHHFGALSGIVACHVAKENVQAAQYWATRRLPMDYERRRSWVNDALDEYHRITSAVDTHTNN